MSMMDELGIGAGTADPFKREYSRNSDRDQAISFAYGNLKIDRPDLKREDVEKAYDELHPIPAAELFYIQDTRTVTGNSALWWREGGHGYTSNLDEAWKVAATWSSGRDTDVLRPCAEVDRLAERHFDVQKLSRIKGTRNE